MPRSLWLPGAIGLSWLALAGSAPAAELSGNYIIAEGKFAGTPLIGVDSAGKLHKGGSNESSGAHGFIREPNANCPDLHFEGYIGKKRIKESDCVRVTSDFYAQEFLKRMSFAITQEQGKVARTFIDNAIQNLGDAYDELQKAHGAGTIGDAGFSNLEDDFFKILKLDKRAKNELKDEDNDGKKDDRKEAEELLEKAIKLKHDIVQTAPDEMKYLRAPQLTPLTAEFQPANFRTVYTEAIAKNPDGRTLTYSWSLVELNDPGCVSFQPNLPLTNQAIWNHPDSQCNHALEGSNGHQGIVGVVVNDGRFSCTAIYLGSNSGTSTSLPVCSQISIK